MTDAELKLDQDWEDSLNKMLKQNVVFCAGGELDKFAPQVIPGGKIERKV